MHICVESQELCIVRISNEVTLEAATQRLEGNVISANQSSSKNINVDTIPPSILQKSLKSFLDPSEFIQRHIPQHLFVTEVQTSL